MNILGKLGVMVSNPQNIYTHFFLWTTIGVKAMRFL